MDEAGPRNQKQCIELEQVLQIKCPCCRPTNSVTQCTDRSSQHTHTHTHTNHPLDLSTPFMPAVYVIHYTVYEIMDQHHIYAIKLPSAMLGGRGQGGDIATAANTVGTSMWAGANL